MVDNEEVVLQSPDESSELKAELECIASPVYPGGEYFVLFCRPVV